MSLSLDGGSSATLVARCGFGTAMATSLLSRTLRADDALARGVVDDVVHDDLPTTAAALVRRLADGPTEAFAATKTILGGVAYRHLEEQLETEARFVEQLIGSRDFAEAVDAYGAGRTPSFGRVE